MFKMPAAVFGVILFLGLVNGTQGADLGPALQSFHRKDYKNSSRLLTLVPSSDPDYQVARYYNALCSYETKDSKKFRWQIDKMRKDDSSLRSLTADQKEDLDVKYSRSSFMVGDYPAASAGAETFLKSNPQSQHVGMVREIAMLSRFELGRKSIRQSVKLNEGSDAKEKKVTRWTMGQTQFKEFIKLYENLDESAMKNFQVADGVQLKRNVWLARILTNDEERMIREKAKLPKADQEEMSFVRAMAHVEYFSVNWKENLGLLKEFLAEYPASKNARKARNSAVNIAYSQGAALLEKAGETAAKGDDKGAVNIHLQALGYLKESRELCTAELMSDPTLMADDIAELRKQIMKTYFIEGNFDDLLRTAIAFQANVKPGTRHWATAKVYEGVALANRQDPDWNGATKDLDAVLVANIKNSTEPCHAAYWRAWIAEKTDDPQTLQRMVDLVQSKMPASGEKTNFMDRFGANAAKSSIKSQ